MKISALENISLAKLSEIVTVFFSWWWGELRALVPRSIERWFGDDLAYVLVRIDENQAQLVLCSEGGEQSLGYCDLVSGNGLDVESLRQTVRERVPEDTRVEVELSEQRVLANEVFLPVATEQTLDQVIRFEMDRFTPFRVDQVGYSWSILDRIPEREKLRVGLDVVRRDYVVELLADLAQLGLSVNTVYLKPKGKIWNNNAAIYHPGDGIADRIAEQNKSTRINLLPTDLLPTLNPLWDKANKNLLAVLVILLGAVISLPIYLQHSQIASLEAEIAALQTRAVGAGEKQRLLVAHLEGQEILANKKNKHSTKLENIRELTELLPDSTWVSKLVIDGSDISIQGESNKSSDLIGILEQTRRFKNVVFASPVTRNPSSNMERYEIRMQLVGLESANEMGMLEQSETSGGVRP